MAGPGTAVLMFIAHRYAEERIFAGLADAGFEISLAQGRLLARVAEGGSRLTVLAEAAQVTKQTAGYLVDQLEAAGYAERTEDPTDARARLVVLSERGRQVQRAARRIERQIEREWTAHLGESRMRDLRSALVSLREITDPWA
jgi:DNA-binding MarR family transcriptional regulator